MRYSRVRSGDWRCCSAGPPLRRPGRQRRPQRRPRPLPRIHRRRRSMPTRCRSTSSKIQRAVSRPAAIRTESIRPVFRVQVFSRSPTIDDILGPDWRKGPTPLGAMTHQEFLDIVTPNDVKGYAAFDNKQALVVAATSFALKWAVQKALDKLDQGQDRPAEGSGAQGSRRGARRAAQGPPRRRSAGQVAGLSCAAPQSHGGASRGFHRRSPTPARRFTGNAAREVDGRRVRVIRSRACLPSTPPPTRPSASRRNWSSA